MMTSFVPGMPFSNSEARSGEFAVKYGPSVNSAVRPADVVPAPHASVDTLLVLLLVVPFVALFAVVDVVLFVRGAAVPQAATAMIQITPTTLKIIFLFICFLHF